MSFSIIICSYNPDEVIFNRLLTAIKKITQRENNPPFDITIVDNNSSPALIDRQEIRTFINEQSASILIEKQPGLTSARIAGVKAAKNDWIIFFDDDNEPASDYLLKTQQLINDYPGAGVLGPGKIKVEFVGKASDFAKTHKELFQERNQQETIIDNVRWGQYAYPYGTGMIVKKQIADEYVKQVEKGSYTMSDRVGKSLISGGDIQILLTGIKMGYYAGSSPSLELTHLIKSEKTAYKKMLQLVFMLSASAVKTYNEVFTDAPFNVSKVSNKDVMMLLYNHVRYYGLRSFNKESLFNLSRRMGELQAQVLAAGDATQPMLLRQFVNRIN